MANQPTKYKKFVATAATATLVASAIVPVASAASFTDVNPETNSHAAAIDALVEQGIIQGYQDGTFKPNATLTRGHVVKMLGKWVEAQGFEVPADWNTVARFSDLAVDNKDQELVKYAAVVKDAGVFNGSNGALNASGSITRENMALTLDRAYAAVFGQSLVEEAAGLVDLTVSDLASAKEEAREAIQALRNLEVSNVNTFMPKDAVTRAQFASFLYRTINVSGETTTPPTGEVAIASLKASKVNELTVEFNKAVDTNAAAFEVKQGNTVIKVSDVEWNEAGTVATLTVDHKFVAATYNLTVTGLSEEALTASVTTTREVASEVKFNSNALVLTGVEKGASKEARITFDIFNQYGEIITDTMAITKSNTDVKVRGIDENDYEFLAGRNGVLVVWVDEDEKEGTTGTITLTYEQGDIELETTQDVTLSDEAEPGLATIVGIHSDSGYDFTAENVEKVFKNVSKPGFTDDFVVLFTLKDQFGAEISARDITSNTTADSTLLENIQKGLRFSVSNDDIFELDEDEITYKVVDGKYYFAAKTKFTFDRNGNFVKETGENTVTFRSKATGDEATAKITLESSSKVYSVVLDQPSTVVAGNEDVYVPVKVSDQDGNAIVNAAELNRLVNKNELDVEIDGNENYPSTFIEKDGAVFLKFKTPSTYEAEEIDIEIEVVNSKEDSEITLNVQPDAYPRSIVKVNAPTALYYLENVSTTADAVTVELELEDFTIEDQYGRKYDKYLTDKELAKNLKLTATTAGATAVKATAQNTIDKSNGVIVLESIGKGSNSVQFELTGTYVDEDRKSQSIISKLDVTFRSVNEKDFVSYVIDTEDFIYGGQATTVDATEVEVQGVLGNGQKVDLPAYAFEVVPASDLTLTAAGSKFVVAKSDTKQDLFDTSGTNTIDSAINIVIGQTGETVSKAVKITDAKTAVKSIKFEDKDSASGQALESLDFTFSPSISGAAVLTEVYNEAKVTIKDQYGYKAVINLETGKLPLVDEAKNVLITISDVSNDDAVIKNNGTFKATVEKLESGDSFTMTVTIDGVSRSIKVYAKTSVAK